MREFLESHLMELSSYSNVRGRGVRCSLENQSSNTHYSAGAWESSKAARISCKCQMAPSEYSAAH